MWWWRDLIYKWNIRFTNSSRVHEFWKTISVNVCFIREWNGDLKKLPNIKLRKVSNKGLEVRKEEAEREEPEEDLGEDEDDEDEGDVDENADELLLMSDWETSNTTETFFIVWLKGFVWENAAAPFLSCPAEGAVPPDTHAPFNHPLRNRTQTEHGVLHSSFIAQTNRNWM